MNIGSILRIIMMVVALGAVIWVKKNMESPMVVQSMSSPTSPVSLLIGTQPAPVKAKVLTNGSESSGK